MRNEPCVINSELIAHTNKHTHEHTVVHTRTHTCTNTHSLSLTHTHKHKRTHTHTQTHKHTHTHTCTYTLTHKNRNTHSHTRTHTRQSVHCCAMLATSHRSSTALLIFLSTCSIQKVSISGNKLLFEELSTHVGRHFPLRQSQLALWCILSEMKSSFANMTVRVHFVIQSKIHAQGLPRRECTGNSNNLAPSCPKLSAVDMTARQSSFVFYFTGVLRRK